MANIGYATLSVIPSAAGFSSALSRDITPGLSGVGRTAGKVLGAGLLIGTAAVVAGIGAIIKTGVGEAMDASAGTAQLAAGIKSTGNAAGVSVDSLNALASSIQGYSGQTDDSIVQSEALLLTFTNIKNGVGEGSDIFDRATVATANMAARMGGDAAGSAIQLGKALNDPVKGVASLTRMGVQFTDAQKDTIAALVESGDVMGAQKVILAELETQFGGAAAAAGQSLPGQLAIAKRSFEDVSQSVVEGLLPMVLPGLTSIGSTITEKVIPAIGGFIQGFKDGEGPGGRLRDILAAIRGGVLEMINAFKEGEVTSDGFAGVMGRVGLVARAIYDVFQTRVMPVLRTAAGFITGTVVPGIASFVGWLQQNAAWLTPIAVGIGAMVVAFTAYNAVMTVVRIATAAWAAVQAVLNIVLSANPIGIVVLAIVGLVAALVYAWNNSETFRNVVMTVWAAIQTAVRAVVDWFTVTIPALWDQIVTWTTEKWNAIVGFFSAIPGRVGAFFTMVKDKILEVFSWTPLGLIVNNWDAIMAWLGGLPGRVGDTVSGLWDGIWTSFKGSLNRIIGAWNDFKITMGGGTTPWGATWPSFTIDTPNIPLLAEGALVTNPALAMLGESGHEAVLPFSRVDEFAAMVARRMGQMDLGKPDGRQGAGNVFNVYEVADANGTALAIARRLSQGA